MINIYKIPLYANPINYLSDFLRPIDSEDLAVIVPTNRNLRLLISKQEWKLDILTVHTFTKIVNNYNGVLLPKELRAYYLYKAAKELTDEQRQVLFLSSSMPKSYLDFYDKVSTLLPFYREISVEMIDSHILLTNSLYEDYEDQIKVILKLWDIFTSITMQEGFYDEWNFFKAPCLIENAVKRYKRYIFLIGGYLSKYELSQFKKMAEYATLDIFFNFVEEPHHQADTIFNFLGSSFAQDESKVKSNRELFLSKNKDENSSSKIKIGSYSSVPMPDKGRNLEIVSAGSIVSQYDLITRRIMQEHLINGISFKDMAVVIPSERMLPLFHYTDPFNLFDISAGIPFVLSDFYINLENLYKLLTASKGGLLSIAFLEIFSDCNWFTQEVKDKLKSLTDSKEKLYIEFNEIKDVSLLKPFVDTVAPFLEVKSDSIALLKHITLLFNSNKDDNYESSMQTVITALELLAKPFEIDGESVSPVLFLKYVLNTLSALKTPSGKGKVSVIGVLESRNLSFKYLFIPDMNQDVFPKTQDKDLYLNSQTRKNLGLPTYLNREELQKSYIYQLIVRADKTLITFIKDEQTRPGSIVNELLSFSDLSESDIKNYNPDSLFIFPKNMPTADFPLKKPVKDKFFIQCIKDMIHSATSLSMYRSCPLKFYYRYIAGVKEPDLPESELNMRLLGEIFHKVMETIGRSGITPLEDEYLTKMKEIYDRFTSKYDYFTKNAVGFFQAEALKEGFYKLVEYEKERYLSGWRVQSLEDNIKATIFGISFKARIDRIDVKEKAYAVIDYKYKKVMPDKKSDNFDKTDIQLPLYALILEKRFNNIPDELLWFDMKYAQGFVEGFDISRIDSFREYLKELIDDMLCEGELVGSSDPSLCSYCPYNKFCYKRNWTDY